jgi:hypothetical protein
VILVEFEQVVGRDRPAAVSAPPGQGGPHLRLADRMPVVEFDDVAHGVHLMRLTECDTKRSVLTPLLRGSAMSSVGKAGLEDVVVSTSDICFIDGREGRLVYRGYNVDDLAAQSNFEEVVYLLWHGALPSKKEYETFNKALSSTANRKLPTGLVALLRTLPKKTTPMEVLRTGVSALSSWDPTPPTTRARRRSARPCG